MIGSGQRKSKHNTQQPAVRVQIRWVRGTFAALYEEYAEATSLNHATEIDAGTYRVPGFTYFMQHKPMTIRKEGKLTCLCSSCLDVDLCSEAMGVAISQHRRRHASCGCAPRATDVRNGRASERAALCPRAAVPL